MVVIIFNRILCNMKSMVAHSPNFIVMWRQLVKELLHAILLSHRVHIGHLVVGESGEEEVHLGSSMVMSDFHRSGAVVGAD